MQQYNAQVGARYIKSSTFIIFGSIASCAFYVVKNRTCARHMSDGWITFTVYFFVNSMSQKSMWINQTKIYNEAKKKKNCMNCL